MAAASRNVLLPVDGSDQSRKAFEWYCTHLYHEGDTAIFLNVYILPEMYDASLTWPAVKDVAEDWNYNQHVKEKEADELLQRYEKKCKENCFSSKSNKIPLSFGDAGKVAEKICDFSVEEKADIIVMNHHGDKTEGEELGSTCSYCVKNAKIPVCVLFLP
ncbi:uncharacterized protein LOC116300486 [Actinia tenebrosa]|uniref:Uncharacterized protein LOC116300486 n=1 Tax=Actinia tenebrosa TaxID=6105 RepID=A0A6P8IAN3_ACTTE|nr:uncharacterized protein LOC116300486 [Actinia tenebrosa]